MSDYAIRRFRPDDAPGVAECFRRVYGASYVHPEIYHPKQIVLLNESGHLISVVAVDAAGEVVGHYALERPELGVIAEEGEALVLPEHRHHNLMDEMRALLETEAHALDLVGLFGQAVTNHIFSQKVHERFGLTPCAISLGATPSTFHNMPEPLPQRMSLVIGFKYLRPPPRSASFVPPQHQAMCSRIFQQLGTPVEVAAPQSRSDLGQIAVEKSPELQSATIKVRRVGKDTAAQVKQESLECRKSGAEAVFLELPLADAGTPDLCATVEEAGYFFSGVGPYFAAGGDVLLLQSLAVPLDLSLVQVDSPLARELIAYVGRERQRIGA